MDPKVWPTFFLPAMIYTAETLLLAFVLNNIELGLYIIARTSYSIFNWFSYRYIVKRTLNRYYYIGIVLLALSYVFVLLDFSSTGSTLGKDRCVMCGVNIDIFFMNYRTLILVFMRINIYMCVRECMRM